MRTPPDSWYDPPEYPECPECGEYLDQPGGCACSDKPDIEPDYTPIDNGPAPDVDYIYDPFKHYE